MKTTVFFLLFLVQLAHAQSPGSLDVAFGDQGKVITQINKSKLNITSAALQWGKIIVAGFIDTSGTPLVVARYDKHGKLDPSFGNKGIVITHQAVFFETRSMLVRPNGKIVVSGSIVGKDNNDIMFVQYLPDGDIDSTFGIDGIARIADSLHGAITYSMSLRPDGKIVASGVGFDYDIVIVQIDSNGKADQGFGTKGVTATKVTAISVDYAWGQYLQADGKCIIGGGTDNGVDTSVLLLLRYTKEGVLDQTFGLGGMQRIPVGTYWDYLYDVTIDAEGRILAAGGSYQSAGRYDILLAAFDSMGSLIPEFGTNGITLTDVNGNDDAGLSISLQPDGKILVSGATLTPDFNRDFALLRYKKNGTLDSTFGMFGVVKTDFNSDNDGALAMLYLQSGKILLAGTTATDKNITFAIALAQYHSGLAHVADNINDEQIELYPNPIVGREATLRFNTPQKFPLEISLIDLNGKLLYDETYPAPAADELPLTLPDLSKGYYKLLVKVADATQSLDLIK